MYSSKREPRQLLAEIKQDKETQLFGISFSQPPNTLSLYKQHLYSLYLLLYAYGEVQHKNKIINRIARNLTQLSIKVERHTHKCGPNDDSPGCIQKKNTQSLIQLYSFVQDDLIKQKTAVTFHSPKQRSKFRKVFKHLFEQDGKSFESQYMNLFDFAKLAGSILGLKCEIRQFYNFQLVQFKCERFDQTSLQVFIEINRLSNTYSYVKQKKVQLSTASKEEYKRMAASAMKYSYYSTDAYNNMRFVESETEAIQENYDEVQVDLLESIVAVSQDEFLQESAVDQSYEQAMLESEVLVSKKSSHSDKKGKKFMEVIKSSVDEKKEEPQSQFIKNVAYIISKQKNNDLRVVDNIKAGQVLEDESFTQKFDADKEQLKIQYLQMEHLKIKADNNNQLSLPGNDSSLFEHVESRIEDESLQNPKMSKKQKISAKNSSKEQKKFENNYIVKRQFLDQLLDDMPNPAAISENFIITLLQEKQKSNPENQTETVVVKQSMKKEKEQKVKQLPQKQQNLLSTKDSKKPSKLERADSKKLAESRQGGKEGVNFRKNSKKLQKSCKSLEKSHQSKQEPEKVTPKPKNDINKYVVSEYYNNVAPVETPNEKKQSRLLSHSSSTQHVIRLSRQKDRPQTYKFTSRLTIRRDSSMAKIMRQTSQPVLK